MTTPEDTPQAAEEPAVQEPEPPAWWSLKEAARQVGVSERTVRRAVLAGKVTFQKAPGHATPYFVSAPSVLKAFQPKPKSTAAAPVTRGSELVPLADLQRLQVERDEWLHRAGQAEGEAIALRRQLEAIEADQAEADRLRERLARTEALLSWRGRRRLRHLEDQASD